MFGGDVATGKMELEEAFSDLIKWCRSSSAYSDTQNGDPPPEPGGLCKEFIADDRRRYLNAVK